MFIPTLTAQGRLKVSLAAPQVWNGGYGYRHDGSLCVTTDAPTAASQCNGGPLCKADGAVHVAAAAIVNWAGGGIPLTATGAMAIEEDGTVDTDRATPLPMNDAGAVVVDGSA